MVQGGASGFSAEFGLISRNPFGERMAHVAIEERGEELMGVSGASRGGGADDGRADRRT